MVCWKYAARRYKIDKGDMKNKLDKEIKAMFDNCKYTTKEAQKILTDGIVEVKSCPFCGGKSANHPNIKWRDQYVVVYHKSNCWLNEDSEPPYNFGLIPRNTIRDWNKRA